MSGKNERRDLSETCHLGLFMLRAAIPNKVIVETELPLPGATIRANTKLMHQVLINLITNAWESICDNVGTIQKWRLNRFLMFNLHSSYHS